MTSIFAQLGTQWGAIYSQKVSGGQKIKEGAWLVPEIGFKRYGFLTIAGGTELGIRTLPDSSKKKVGVTPPHLENVGAPCCDNGHTSSKGMPRHAHGRWALMRVCGVDVTDVSLSCWWCVRWLVRTECLE